MMFVLTSYRIWTCLLFFAAMLAMSLTRACYPGLRQGSELPVPDYML